jgi:hypothetical protein
MGTLKIYRWAWFALIVVTIATIAVLVIRTSHHDLAADLNNIEKIVKVDLPDIAFVESEYNLDRGASRWDIYIHSGQFAEELSEECIKAINELCVADRSHWCKEEEYYAYFDRGGIDDLYFVTCIIYHDHFKLTYEVDESEGIFVLFPFVIAYMILFAWGIILLIIRLFRRKK